MSDRRYPYPNEFLHATILHTLTSAGASVTCSVTERVGLGFEQETRAGLAEMLASVIEDTAATVHGVNEADPRGVIQSSVSPGWAAARITVDYDKLAAEEAVGWLTVFLGDQGVYSVTVEFRAAKDKTPDQVYAERVDPRACVNGLTLALHALLSARVTLDGEVERAVAQLVNLVGQKQRQDSGGDHGQ